MTASWRILEGDCRDVLATLPARSVHTCMTSPPYFGLRDYGHDGQIGLEPTPDEFVEAIVTVFREVRRVLRDDGTVWLNLGDSYAGGGRTGHEGGTMAGTKPQGEGNEYPPSFKGGRWKPKDLLGIPWMVAEELRAPYYTGRIHDERDRIWLAAMIDAEGCLYIHKRKADHSNGQSYERKNDSYSPGLEISSTDSSIVQNVMSLVGRGSICSQSPEQDERRRQTIYRWTIHAAECRDLVREIYPYLVAKQHEARIVLGCATSGDVGRVGHEALKMIHQGGVPILDMPAPASMFEPGFYLRSDVIWSKANPMPESVTDRPTKAHEYLFLLSKGPRYFYDADAIREPAEYDGPNGAQQSPYAQGFGRRTPGQESERREKRRTVRPGIDTNGGGQGSGSMSYPAHSRNKRSVWTVATQPYAGAHFATFPPKLIEPCILAGCPEGGTVLDPFAGAGTTGMVALRHNRSFVGIELSPVYARMARQRIIDDAPLLNTVAEVAA